MSELATLRDEYVRVFNSGDMDALEALLHPDVVYRWVASESEEVGRAKVMELYRRGWDAFGGASRLAQVRDTDDQAVWLQPTCNGLEPAGLQTIAIKGDLIVEIADEHDPDKVEALANRLRILMPDTD